MDHHETHYQPHLAKTPLPNAIVLFDGICNLCTWSVQHILRHDPSAYFHFAAQQSPIGRHLLHRHGIDADKITQVVLIENGIVWTKSDAALRIARRLTGWWPLLSLLVIVPRPIRDHIYAWIAAHRYRWFGQTDACMVPTPATRERFLETNSYLDKTP